MGGWRPWVGRLLVRLVLVSPLQAIVPCIVALFLRRLLSVPSGSRLRWLALRSVRQLLRTYCSLELFFCVYFFVRRRQLQSKPIPHREPMSKGERQAFVRRILNSIDEIDYEEDRADDALPSRKPSTMSVGSEGSNATITSSNVSVESLCRRWSRQWGDDDEGYEVVVCGASDDGGDSDGKAIELAAGGAGNKLAMKRAAVSGWFMGADCSAIQRGNVEQWVAWAFFLKRGGGLDDAERKEVASYADDVAAWADLPHLLQTGFNDQVKCIRLEFDPIIANYRPLVYYAVTAGLVTMATKVLMGWLGFTRLTNGCLTYWHRPPSHSPDTQGHPDPPLDPTPPLVPLVFCHGLGVGVVSYITLVKDLVRRCPHRELFMVELPHISMRPVEAQASPTELVTSIRDLLAAHRCLPRGAHFVGHSFGSIVLTWVTRIAPELACRLTFLDPVCFLLCKHDVAYNFLHKPPANAQEAMMQWFVGRELFIAFTLSRRFWWQSNILFPDQLRAKTTVVLSSDDHIVPSHSVRRFLTSWDRARRRRATLKRSRLMSDDDVDDDNDEDEDEECQVDVVWLQGCGHAGFLLSRPAQQKILDIIAER